MFIQIHGIVIMFVIIDFWVWDPVGYVEHTEMSKTWLSPSRGF